MGTALNAKEVNGTSEIERDRDGKVASLWMASRMSDSSAKRRSVLVCVAVDLCCGMLASDAGSGPVPQRRRGSRDGSHARE